MIITTIQGVVVTTIRDTKVVMASIKLKTKRPMKINAQARQPVIRVALGRLSLGKTLEKSRPVPYSDVVPVDIPLIMASSNRGKKNLGGAIAINPPV